MRSLSRQRVIEKNRTEAIFTNKLGHPHFMSMVLVILKSNQCAHGSCNFRIESTCP